MNPAEINLSSLPSLPLAERKSLPAISAVYFVLSGDALVYIGRTSDLLKRWGLTQHHRMWQVERMADVRIAWIALSIDQVNPVETACVRYFDPPMNRRRPYPRYPSRRG